MWGVSLQWREVGGKMAAICSQKKAVWRIISVYQKNNTLLEINGPEQRGNSEKRSRIFKGRELECIFIYIIYFLNQFLKSIITQDVFSTTLTMHVAYLVINMYCRELFKWAIINIFIITMYQTTVWKQCDNVKGVARGDERTEIYHLSLRLPSPV